MLFVFCVSVPGATAGLFSGELGLITSVCLHHVTVKPMYRFQPPSKEFHYFVIFCVCIDYVYLLI